MTTSIQYESIAEYVAILAGSDSGFSRHGALVDFGRDFAVAGKSPHWLAHGPMKECFTNAQYVALSRPDVFYVEGYAVDLDVGIPMEHAWLCDAQGVAIDPTWKDAANCEYYGIAFTRDFLEAHAPFANGAGLLHPPLMRRRYGTREALAAGVVTRLAALAGNG